MRRLGFALPLCLIPALLRGQEPPAPKACRPLFTTSAGPTDPGVLELELGAQEIHNQDGSADRLVPTQLNLGLTPWLDLRMGWGGPMLRKDSQGNTVNGGTDPVLGGQALFLRQAASGLDLGLAFWHKVPRASTAKGIGSGKVDDTLLLTASRTWGPLLVDVNAGANFIGRPDGDGRVRQGAASIAFTVALGSGWNLTLDTYALAATELNRRATSSILAVSRDVSPDLCLDLGVEAGHTDGAPKYSFNAGLVWRIGRLWAGK
jgi:hypothetical protein